MSIHIYGYGTVGQAVHSLFKDENVEISDPQKGYEIKDYEITDPVDGSLIVFICLDDLEVIKQIIKKYCFATVVIKSTLKTSDVPEDAVVNPEFLCERTSFEDIKYEHQIVGGDYAQAKPLLDLYDKYRIPYTLCSVKEACYAKFTHNLYSIWKHTFWEMIHDVTSDSRLMYDLYALHPTDDLEIVGLDGKRGVQGKCFPKNLEAVKDSHVLLSALYNYLKELK